MKKRITALILVLVMVLSIAPQVSAASIEDYPSGVNVMIRSETPHTYLDVQTGGYTTGLSARIWSYISADNKVSGPAYCISHGSGYPNGYIAVNTTPYTANPTMIAAFSSGFPLVPLETFIALHPSAAGLTRDEYGYASQVAVWAALGQVSVEGTAYTSGSEKVVKPTDTAKLHIYNALVAILESASSGSSTNIGIKIRSAANAGTDTVDLGSTTSLDLAAQNGTAGIQAETINGKEYYTCEFTLTSTAMPDSGSVILSLSGAPSGTILTNSANQQLSGNAVTLSVSGSEYAGTFKVCVPADAAEATATGSITIQAAASIASCTFYLVDNSHAYEQDFIIADPNSGSSNAAGYLKWGERSGDEPDTGNIRLLKTDENGAALAGAEFDIDGSAGYHASGTTDANGSITWTDLPVGQGYTITETVAPEGYQLADPISVTAKAGQTVYVTVTDSSEKTFRVHKQDKQSGYSLEGAVFRFEQIDGSFVVEGRTGADGIIELTPSKLPYGSYRVSELSAPDGYEKDNSVKTVDWDGKADIDLYFTNMRKIGFKVLKVDANTNVPLAGAYFDIYKDGELIDTVRTNEQGIATVSGLSEGYYEAVERIAPYGYVLDSTPHGIHLDPVNPATSEDPVLRITNKVMPQLRIVKLDAQTMQPLAGATFEVMRDATLIGNYTTDSRGEIYLNELEDGTYTVTEISAPGTHVTDSTPQTIELEAGATETYSLVFLNYVRPGIRLVKIDSQTFARLPNAKFRITQVGGTFSQEYTTDANGEIDLDGLDPGSYTVVELSAPEGYLIDDAERIIKIEGGDYAEFVFTDTRKPTLRLVKLDSLTGERLPGATYRIAKIADGSHYLDRVTDINGEINISDLEPGVYSAQELAAPEGYVLDTTEFHVELFPGQTSQLVVSDDVKPDLRIVKQDADTGEFLTGATFKVRKADGATLTSELTDTSGEIKLEGLDPGVYEVIEQAPPVGYLPARQSSQLITLTANKLGTVIFQNYAKPTLTVNKISSVSGEPLKGARFQVTYRSNNTETGSMRDLGYYLTDDNGQFSLTDLTDGWYTITELESVAGYSIKEPATQNVYIKGGEDKVLTFQNTPLSALVVYKYDTVDGTAVSNAVFQIKKLTDTSGTGGTVIGTYRTTANGSFTVTGLAKGTYIVEELASDNGHVIDAAPQTAYISGEQTDVVELYFGNTPKGSVLISKIDAVTHEPLSDVEFLVTDSAGTVIGDANGKYVTDSAGTILIDNLDPGTTVIVKETKAKANYVLDDVPQAIKVRAGRTVTLEFRNAPYGGLLIRKIDSSSKEPLEGAVFQVVASDGSYADNYGGMTSSNGRYVTDVNGQIRLYDLKPDTYVVTEVEAPEGYVLSAEPQTVRVNSGDLQTLVFGNPKKGAIVLTKRDFVTGAPMEGVTFYIKNSSGEPVGDGEYRTDSSGQITVTDLAPDTYVVTETATISGYVLDTTARNVVVKAGETRALNLTNRPKGNLVVQKLDSITKEPLAGAVFKITTSNGTLVDDNEGLTSSTGLYTTDENGQIYLSKLSPATYIITEQTAPANYKLASGSKTVMVRAADTQTVTFTDDPLCTLTILKRDAVTKKGLAGAEFLVKYSDGTEIGSNNGRYVTGSDGTVTVSGLTPDATVVVSETRAPKGYIKDETAKTLVVRTGVANSLTFDDEPTTTLIIRKYIDGTAYEPLAGVAFKVIDGSGAAVGPDDGVYYTDEAGEIVLDNIEPGTTVTAREIKTVDGFVLNGNPQDILIKEGQVQSLTFWNQRKGSVTILKLDSVTKEPLAGVQFKVTYADGRVVDTEDGKLSSNGLYTTDANGRITITGVTGTLVVTETKTIPGYTIDEGTRTQTVVVRPDDGQTLTFLNDPMQTLTIQKYVTGSTTPIQGVEFLVTDSSGAVVGPNNGEYVTDEDGRIVISGLVPGTTITARETRVPSGYVLNSVPKSIRIKEGDAQQMTFFNDRKGTLILQKQDSVSGVPLVGAEFLITTIDGEYLDDNEGRTSTKGVYVTDGNGEIRLLNLEPNTYVIKETKAPDGYVQTQQELTVKVNVNDTQTVTVLNTPRQTVVIQKFVDGTTTPLAGVTFLVTDGKGNPVGSASGEHTTDANGRIVLTGLTPGTTLVAKEVRTAKGYVLNGSAQTIVVGESGTTTTTTPATGNASVGGNTMTFYDEAMNSLTIHKYIAGTDNEPLAGVAFKVTDGSGAAVGTDDGVYYTDAAGEIVLLNMEPDTTITVREIKTVDGFVLDGTPQDIQIGSGGDNQNLTFWNARQGSVTIRKLDSVTKKPLAGVEFKITYADGRYVDKLGGKVSSNGIYFTDKNGEILISGITGTLVITEEKTIEGYTIDESTRTQTVEVKPDDGQILYFYNTPIGGVELIKVNEANRSQRIANTTFEIRKMDGALVTTITTDKNGRAYASLDAGSYYAVEIVAGDGFVLDATPTYFEVKSGATTSKTITNKPFSGITIHKTDSASGKGIYGVTFMLYDLQKNPIEQLVTDNYGYARTTKELTAGQYLLREIEAAEGYLPDNQYKTVNVTAGKNTTVEWQNTPVMAQIQIIKYAAEDNPVTGQTKGTTLQGAVYEVVRERSGAVVGQIVTDARGVAAITLPLGRYQLREVTAPAYWQLSGQTFDLTLEFAGQIIKVADYDRPATLGVTITKTGVKEVLAGSQMTYRFKIANTSNVVLENFFWHDKLPYDITSATALTTGTYNQRLSYRILYKTNYNDYRVLASNLLTTNNYSYRLSALSLSSGEVVTDIYFDFGTVPAGFQSTTLPTLTVQVSPTAANGYQVTNRADAGGKYGNTWETGNSGWVTTVKNLNPPKTTPLPKTGY